jgi:hypothetical protein
MALTLSDRVKETCSSPGTGTVSLLGAQTGFQAFSTGVGNGNTCYYTIADQSGTHWEVGIGTYSSTGNTLTRTTPLSGSTTTPVNFSSGTQDVFVTYPAEKAVTTDIGNAVSATTATNLASGSTYALPYQSGVGNTTFLSAGTSGSVLITTGTFGPPTWIAQSSMIVGAATNIASGSAGEIPFQTGSGATSFTAVGTAGQVLTSQGTGTPTWTTPTTGTVTSVTGTAPIVSSGGTTPAISMPVATSSANGYLASTDWTTFNNKSPAAGSTSITTLGTITTGTWNASVIGAAYGGTGEAGTLTGILYGNGTSPFTVATTAQLLSGIGTLPVANGGTGLTSLTANYIPFGNGTGAFGSSSALTFSSGTLTVGTAVVSPTIGSASGSALSMQSNGTTNATLDTNGNLGLGVTPSSWVLSQGGAFQFGAGYGSLFAYSNAPTLGCNIYYTTSGGGFKYFSSAAASAYQQLGGVHYFLNAPSGTANATATMSIPMQIGAGVSIGNTTDPGAKNLSVSGSLTLGTTLSVSNGGTGLTSLTQGYIPFGQGTSAFGSSSNLFWDNTNFRLGINTASPLYTFDARGNGLFYAQGGTQLILTTNSSNNTTLNFGSYGAAGNVAQIIGNGGANYLQFYTNGSASPNMQIGASGGVSIGNTTDPGAKNLSVSGTINTGGYTVATLPTGVTGARAYVTNALSPVFGSTVAGGGAVTVPVFYNGSNWIVG